MKIVVSSDGRRRLSLSRDEWFRVGRKAKWVVAEATDDESDYAVNTPGTLAKKLGVPAEQAQKEYAQGLKIEKEHTDLLDLFKKFLSEHKLEMPISDEEFFGMIAKVHIEEVPDYYEKLVKHVEPKKS